MPLPARIAVLTGDPSLPDPTKQHQRYGPEDLAVHAAMKEAFASIPGLETFVLEEHATMFDELERIRPDLVVNFCDTGLHNRPEKEIHVVTALDELGLPYTGAPPRAMLICFDKQIVRLLADSLGVPVPRERFLPAGSVRGASIDEFPALIKPNAADGSVGITQHSLVENPGTASDYLDWLATELPDSDVLVQEYLPGPEYGLGLLGNPGFGGGLTGLPMLEVDFSSLPEGLPPILSFESKAYPDSPYWTDIRFRPAGLPERDQSALVDRCHALFARLGLRDYGRFDFRTAADGTVRLMEVNPNPAWGFDAKLATMAGMAGWSYADLLKRLVETAWGRIRASR